jgi:hypothetical protein
VTDRKTLDQMTSNDLDQLHAEVDRLTAELADYDRRVEELEATAEQHARNTLTVARERESYRKAWKDEQKRRARAEAALARVRALADRWDNALAPDRTYARALHAALDEPAPGPAATQATDGRSWLHAGTRDLSIPEQHTAPTVTTGLVVQPYRNDRGQPAWVFRCWGTDTCDGWLSLDHTSEQSAQRARDRHVADEHKEQHGV